MFERIKETWEALRSRRKLQNLKEFKCVECNLSLWKNIKIEPGCIVPVCKDHLQEDLHLTQERLHRRLNMEPVKIVVSPLDHDLRKLLWEVRYHLRAIPLNTQKEEYPHILEGRVLGHKLEKALAEQDLPSSPPPTKLLEAPCPRCNEPLVEAKRGSLAWVCPKCSLPVKIEDPEEEIKR